MSFLLQQGYGMMTLNKELTNRNNNLGVILSPRALQNKSNIERLEKHAKTLKKNNVGILFDPQFYEPRTNMDKILKYPYFEGLDYETAEFSSHFAQQFSRNVISYQVNNIEVDEIIIPNVYTNSISTDWYNISEALVNGAQDIEVGKVKYLTIPLGPDVIKNKDSFDDLISVLTQYEVDGYYFVFKRPKDFLTDEEDYLYSLLDAFISLNLANKRVIIGYANQQDLIFASSGVASIASGNFRNVRSFDPNIFIEEEDDDTIKKRATWYYDRNTLSEYRIQQLVLAERKGLLHYFGPTCEYCENLLENPATAIWKENDAFKHYLFELNRQWESIKEVSPSERVNKVINILENAESNLKELSDNGFRIGNRAFNEDAMEASLNALYAIKADRKYDLQELTDI